MKNCNIIKSGARGEGRRLQLQQCLLLANSAEAVSKAAVIAQKAVVVTLAAVIAQKAAVVTLAAVIAQKAVVVTLPVHSVMGRNNHEPSL